MFNMSIQINERDVDRFMAVLDEELTAEEQALAKKIWSKFVDLAINKLEESKELLKNAQEENNPKNNP